MKPDIVEFVSDPQLLGLSVSPAQETLLRAVYGLPLRGKHLVLYRDCTGRTAPPAQPFSEVTVIAGARSGKDSRIAAPIVLYEAVCGGHEAHLHRGERGVIPLVAQDARATRIAFSYIRDYLTSSPLLAGEVAEILASEIVLRNGMSILCFPCTQRSLRGWSIPAAVMDELAFYPIEGAADADVEIQMSVRRGMVGFPQTRLVKISTPYAQTGVLYDDFTRAWGQAMPDLLVWRASTELMNPSISAARLERERRVDPVRFEREYGAEFATNFAAAFDPELVDLCVRSEPLIIPPRLQEVA